MNQRYDLLAISLLFVTAVLAAWLGIGGPQGSSLKDWQTLIASAGAIGAATLAYRAAMAKVEVDRAEHKREFLRRQLAQYLKLDIALESFRPAVQLINANLAFSDDGRGVRASALRVKEAPELAEAWDNLDVFPRRLIREIATIRASIRRIDDILDEVAPDRVLFGDTGQPDTRFNILHVEMNSIIEACTLIKTGLKPEIEKLAPIIPIRERISAIYGDPDIDED
ncbi:hypothetical protein XI00_01955 [Bradyrhizobium sp. CCBAU 21359]|uniref:hypothetical protein n=1 Tax=Bradyrhizobium sp. CCBAU 21359 TaxID=1325080 RepID=UPI0023064F3F|nr:hypothetical protein [Bradyrhizobium sp. CCBAU 21359]MDA9453063.1 hypothetical protein [Bradyrhizobium sp. CCBAU 21359]